MERLRQRRPRLVLNNEDYAKLRQLVLSRDGWRCQGCGAITNLQVHHLKRRSQFGPDAAENLISLCATCHLLKHNKPTQECRKRNLKLNLEDGK